VRMVLTRTKLGIDLSQPVRSAYGRIDLQPPKRDNE
jgi:hypothetical protein